MAKSSRISNDLTEEHDEGQEHHVIKYILEKLEKYAHKSDLWRLIHASHIRENLLRKSRRVSKVHSISEDFVRQCINQLLNNLDQYVIQLDQLVYSQDFDHLVTLLNPTNQTKTTWQNMQIERARILFPDKLPLDDQQVLEEYFLYIEQNLTPNKQSRSTSSVKEKDLFDLDGAYTQAEEKGTDYLKKLLENFRSKKGSVNISMIDEMIQLGMLDMKQIPRQDEFEGSNNSFLRRFLLFHRVKEAYKCLLQNTSDDFTLLRFGKVFSGEKSLLTEQMNKQFTYLLHLYLKSIAMLFTSLRTTTKETILSSISQIGSIFFFDHHSSHIKLNFDIFSPHSNVDQWTWLLNQWHDILRTMPFIFTQAGAFSRLIRTTIGISLMYLGKLAERIVENGGLTMKMETINEEMFHSLQTGFYFGVAYSVVDCLEDEIHNLDHRPFHQFLQLNCPNEEKKDFSPNEIVDQWLEKMEGFLSGKEFDRIELPSNPFSTMLIQSFENLFLLTKSNDQSFHELALLLRSQRNDQKQFTSLYTDEQLYLGSMLKSHFTYTCTTHLSEMTSAREHHDQTWSMPFLGQLTDDCRDLNDDIKSQSVTPFTYYASSDQRKQLINPLELFLHHCSQIYFNSGKNSQTGSFLGRRIIRTLRSIDITANETSSYSQFIRIFCEDNRPLAHYLSKTIAKQFSLVTDPEKNFFRSVDLASAKYSRTNRKLETYAAENLHQVEKALEIGPFHGIDRNLLEEDLLITAMNYSVQAGGKRLRPLLMLMVADIYQIESTRILPLTSGIEYLHTSSLIFDDLPAQDNSDLRRGRTSLHKTILNDDIPLNLCEGRAQLAAVDLIALSMSLINHGLIQKGFQAECVNRVIGEISYLMHDLCIGQMMDLNYARNSNRALSLEKLDQIAWFKTGKTIEVVLITPLILIKPSSKELDDELIPIRELSKLMGILFQMKDDLLDIEGDDQLGKPKEIDLKNNTTTYLSLLGFQQTKSRLQFFQHRALQLVDLSWPQGSQTIKDVINYIVHRKH